MPNFVVAGAPSAITGCSAIDSEEEVTAAYKDYEYEMVWEDE